MLFAHPLDNNAKFSKMHFAYPALNITYQVVKLVSTPVKTPINSVQHWTVSISVIQTIHKLSSVLYSYIPIELNHAANEKPIMAVSISSIDHTITRIKS